MTEMKPKTTAEFWQRRWKKTPRRVAIWAIFAFIISHFLPYYDESTGETTSIIGQFYFWPGGILDIAEMIGGIIGRLLFPALIAFPCFFLFWPPDKWLPTEKNPPSIFGTIGIGIAIHCIIIGTILVIFAVFQ